jgi:hypothetical protein
VEVNTFYTIFLERKSMNSATLIIIIAMLAVIVVLQIVILIRIGKSALNITEKKPSSIDSKPMRRDGGEREERKERQDSQPRPHQPVSTVDKSLRDINLRLKNAERDQEKARSKMSDDVKPPEIPVRRPPQDRDRDGDRNGDRNRNRDRDRDRDRDRYRDRDRNRDGDRSRDRDRGGRNRGSRDGNYPDRNRNFSERKDSPLMDVEAEEVSPLLNQVDISSPPVIEEAQIASPVTFTEDDLFGRNNKITVKRRSLDSKIREESELGGVSDIGKTDDSSSATGSELPKEPFEASDDTTRTEQPKTDDDGQNISFGRR